MGTFVSTVDASGVETPILPDKIQSAGTWDSSFAIDAPVTIDLVTQKFNSTMEKAEEMLTLLVGGGVNEGYLKTLESIIEAFPTTQIDAINYTPTTIGSDVSVVVASPPEMSGEIDLDFGSFETPAPSLLALPEVDLSGLSGATVPADITAAISWFESSYNTDLFTALFARLMTDLVSGATGIGGTVEQDIYDRAQARQELEEDKIQTEIEEYFASTGFDLPTGALAARLQEHANGRAMRSLDLNQKIFIEQAELAQKNNQFVIEQAKNLEALLRDYEGKKNGMSLDYSKAVAANAVARYAEQIRAYVATLEADKILVQLQIDILKATIESNRGLIESYSAGAKVFEVTVDAKAKGNKAITDVYSAEIAGYDSETKAISENQKNIIQAYTLKIQNAKNDMDAAIAAAEASIKGYTSEYGLRAEVAKAMANIANQAFASAYGAVNTSAGISYSGSESKGESWSHGESRSDSYSHSESVGSTISVQLENSLSESHKFDEE